MSVCKRLCYFSTPSGECKKAENVPCPLEVPMPVVRGRWVTRRFADDMTVAFRCSECHTTWDNESNYCPNCGAKMEV